ncbi:MAG: 3-hydroxyacyl-CoA dehydrogenase family protein [Parachlamydiaceae bacterium]
MNTQAEWQQVVVLGAVGKMGSGIALLLLQEMAMMENAVLTLLDTNPHGFEGLKKYLREHLGRYADRIHISESKEEFVERALKQVRFVTSVEECHGSTIIFEAIIEDIGVKARVLQDMDKQTEGKAFFFSNTSSIPICVLQQKSRLAGRLIGFHFYNPPAVQKLVEIIVPEVIDARLIDLASAIGRRLQKVVVFSNDVAGFIGNGHFIREIIEADQCVGELQSKMTPLEALCTVNRVTQEFLLRPMGIFQLVDYVGIDVCHHIATIMTKYLPGMVFISPMIEEMLRQGIKGGQNPDGSQKNGFFHYKEGRPVSVYDAKKQTYEPYSDGGQLQGLLEECIPWKLLSKDPDKDLKIKDYFSHLRKQQTVGATLAESFLKKSKEIAQGLVKHEVARSLADVDTVLKTGFFHLYGVNTPFE